MDIAEKGETVTPSLMIYRTLENIGVKSGKQLYDKQSDLFFNIFDGHNDDFEIKTSGSIKEGLHFLSFMAGGKGDMDATVTPKNCFAYEQIPLSLHNSVYPLQIHHSTDNPGYVTLELRNEGSSSFFPLIIGSINELCFPLNNNKYLSSLLLTEKFNTLYQKHMLPLDMEESRSEIDSLLRLEAHCCYVTGPSVATDLMGNELLVPFEKIDMVITIKCPQWPFVANEWILRKRQHDWPPKVFIEQHIKYGAEVVPVGCRTSPKEGLEWRLSFNETEKGLICLFNETQFKCYACLKILLNRYIKPHTEVLNSYTMKTTMFWLIEETPFSQWEPQNLLQCIFLGLNRILQQIKDDNCPHYFARNRNMFLGQYNPERKPFLVKLLLDLKTNLWEKLSSTPPFDKNSELIVQNFDESMESEMLLNPKLTSIYRHQLDLQLVTGFNVFNFIRGSIVHDLNSVLMLFENLLRFIRNWNAGISSGTFMYYLFKHQTLSLMEQLMISSENIRSTDVTRAVETAQQISIKYGGISEKVLASFMLFLIEKFQEASSMLSKLLSKDILKTYIRINADDADLIFQEKNINAVLAKSIPLSDLYFYLVESPWLPEPIQKELGLRAESTETHLRNNDGQSMYVKVDPLVYGCYLKFQCSKILGDNIAPIIDLKRFERCCAIESITNKDIAYTLLGHCYSRLDEYEKAYKSYSMALKENSKNKAAHWYINRLKYKENS